MTRKPNTIDTIRSLGYSVGVAHGSVEVEEMALHNAQVDAEPQTVTRRVGQITKDTLADLANMGELPETDDGRQALAARIAADALAAVTEHANGQVEFHQRALVIAKESPDVWRIEQTVATADGDATVASLLVATKGDGTGWDDGSQAVLDALAHQPSFDERVFQAQNAEAMVAAQTLATAGKDVTRELGADTFTVDGKKTTTDQIIAIVEEG